MKFSGIPVLIAICVMSITTAWAGGLSQFGAQDTAKAEKAKAVETTKMAAITPQQSVALDGQYQQMKGKMAEKAATRTEMKRDRLRERLQKQNMVTGAAAKPRTAWQRKHACPYTHKGDAGKVNNAKQMCGEKMQPNSCTSPCCK